MTIAIESNTAKEFTLSQGKLFILKYRFVVVFF